MALDLGELVVRVRADTSGFRREIDAADRTGASFGKRMLGVAKGLAASFGAIKVFGWLKGAVEEARASQKVSALTASAIKATGGAANVTAEQVGKLATALSNKTAVDDEVIQSGANMLLTFKNVRNEVGAGNDIFNKATAAAVDLSAAGFGSVESASVMLGKALNDPIKGVTALQRVGVTFTASQKEQIKALVQTGDVLGAQKIILQEVQSQVGGAAAAQATAADLMRVKWGNFQELIGSLLIPVIDKFLGIMINRVLPALTSSIEWMQRNSDTLSTWAKVIAAVLVPALAAWATASTVAAAKSVAAWVSAAVASSGSAATQSLSAAQVAVRWAFMGTQALLHAGKVAAAWVIAMGPWGILIAAVVAGVALVVKNWDTIAAATQKAWAVVRDWIVNAWKAIIAYVGPTVAQILKVVTDAWNAIRSATQTIWNVVRSVLETVWTAIRNVVTTYVNTVRTVIETAWNAIRALTQTVWNVIRTVLETVWTAIRNVVTTYINAVRTVIETVWNAIRNVTTSTWNAISGFLTSIWNTLRALFTASTTVVRSVVETAWAAIRNTTTSIWDSISGKISSVWNTIRSVAGAAVGALRNTVESTFTAIRDNVGRIWDGILDKVKTPIRITFDFINSKMVGPINSILSKFPGNLKIPSLPKLARGGKVKGPGTSKSDSVPAMLSNGEYVIRADTARKLGTDFLTKLNEGKLISRATGGPATVGGSKVNLNSRGIIDTRGPYYGLYLAEALKKSQGYVRAEDGSWVNPSFYGARPAGSTLGYVAGKPVSVNARGIVQSRGPYYGLYLSEAQKKATGWVRAEDGSWVNPNFYKPVRHTTPDLAGRPPGHPEYGNDDVRTADIYGTRVLVNSKGIIESRGPYYGQYVVEALRMAGRAVAVSRNVNDLAGRSPRHRDYGADPMPRPNDLAGRAWTHFDYGADQLWTTIGGKRYKVNSRGIIESPGAFYGLYVSQAQKIAATRGGDFWDVAKSVAGGAANLASGALDKVGDMASWTKDMLVKGARWAAEKLLVPLRNSISNTIGQRDIPSAMLTGGVHRIVDGVLGKASEAEKAAEAMGAGTGPGSYQWQMQVLRKVFPGLQMISGFRPGAITATGNPSYHGKGRAVDVPPRMDVFNWIRANYGANTKELIFSPAGNRQIHNGRPHMYTGVTRANHWDHVHWAYDQGGWLKPGQRGVNHLGKPEAVLTPEQSKAFVDLAEAIAKGDNGMGRTLIYNAAPGLSLDSERDFIDATGRARMLGW